MNHVTPKEGDIGVDLEAGLLRDPVLDVRNQGWLCSAVCGVEDKAACRTATGAVTTLTVKGSEAGENLSGAEGWENRKKSSNKKAPKPPRPPRSPSLDAADQKLVKEIAELAMFKRARLERMKALKKEKNAKAATSTSSGNAFALVFTVLFIFVILFQGCSPSTKVPVTRSEGPSESVGSVYSGVISVHHDLNHLLASYENGPSYGTPSSTEQANGRTLPHKLDAIVR